MSLAKRQTRRIASVLKYTSNARRPETDNHSFGVPAKHIGIASPVLCRAIGSLDTCGELSTLRVVVTHSAREEALMQCSLLPRAHVPAPQHVWQCCPRLPGIIGGAAGAQTLSKPPETYVGANNLSPSAVLIVRGTIRQSCQLSIFVKFDGCGAEFHGTRTRSDGSVAQFD